MMDEENQVLQQEKENIEQAVKAEDKKMSKKTLGIIGAAVVTILALAVGVVIYNLPANRVARQLSLGEKYLAEQNYEQAALAFGEAIAIDEKNMQAYAGGIEAYLMLEDSVNAEKLYEQAVRVIEEFDGNYIQDNSEVIVGIYLRASSVYLDNYKRITDCLEKGLSVLGDIREISEELVESYLKLAADYVMNEQYEDALKCYDRVLELDKDNEKLLSDLSLCLEKYIEQLIAQRRYDEVRKLIEKYSGIVDSPDFDAILSRITELERIDAENQAFMQNVYQLMEVKDYDAMHSLDGSEEADAFVERMGNEYYIYIPTDETGQNGTGAGVYKFGNGGYYFFYGQIEDGIRKGKGISFCNSSSGGYEVFIGEWDKDAPNGAGEINLSYSTFSDSGRGYSKVATGSFVNGLCDGEIKVVINSEQGRYDMSYIAENGVPTKDYTDEFFSQAEGFTEQFYQDVEEFAQGGKYVYAYDMKNTYDWVYSWIDEGTLLGVVGFTSN